MGTRKLLSLTACWLGAGVVLVAGTACGDDRASAGAPYTGAFQRGGPTTAPGPPTEVVLLPPDATPQQRRGRRVVERSGCEACHRLGANGNDGPGRPLTHVGARLSARQLARVLVRPEAPMPSYRTLQRRQPRDFRAMVAYLRGLG